MEYHLVILLCNALKLEMISRLHWISILLNLFFGPYPSWGIVTTFPSVIILCIKREEKKTMMTRGEKTKSI